MSARSPVGPRGLDPGARPLLSALSGATIISFSAILFRLSATDPITATFFRMSYALPVLAGIWWFRRSEDHRTRSERALAFVAGLFLALDVVVWSISIEQIGAGLSTLIANSQALIVPLMTWALFHERPSRPAFVAMPVVMVGLALITGLGRADTFGEHPVQGVILAVAAAALYSAFLIGYRRSSRSLSPQAGPLLDAVAGATLGAAMAGFAGGIELAPSWPAHGWLLLLALGTQVFGWLLIGYALPRLPAAHTSFAILLQPTLTLFWGRLIFSEGASPVQLVGVALVLSGILIVSAGARQRVLVQNSTSA